MNLHQNIIIFDLIDNSMRSFLTDNSIGFKQIKDYENGQYLIVDMSHEAKIRNLLTDYDLGSYLKSWSDRYTERVYLKGPTIGMGILSEGNENSYDLKDENNYWKFSKGDL